ncbi:DJ-1/PfpI family protein [Herbivorax sp. ANBcel31]|uniref:DJ-1 family glyoxalase III n=1 Tax=Herbivorax sp. ANBcel31 TaxID=3069754 RepID=UPI0027B745A3|nr:DJ-1 family glyoxalase III [Herbivorax sp. ANBcel31]MDQ2085627.1 DJ-1/PfpI family protein [Herbivorax sp. ANBcel31]
MNAYIFLAEGFEEIEAVTVIDTLRRAEIDIKTVSMSESLEVKGSRDVILKADILFDENAFEDAQILILPGGMPGTKNLAESSKLADVLKSHAKGDKYIAAICAAPMVLGKLGLLSGKEATCYPSFESYLDGAKIKEDRVVVDGNFITSKGPGTALEFSLKLVEILKGKELSDKLRKAMICIN